MPPKPPTKRRAPRAVPSIVSHDLYEPVRACEACKLRAGCKGPVPGVGWLSSEVVLYGEAPAENETRFAIPFTGATWEELEALLRIAGLSRDQVYLSNIQKCQSREDPTLSSSAICSSLWLPLELEAIHPRIIVAMGQLAIRTLLGDHDLTVESCHGYPLFDPVRRCWLLPTYHPAAGFYDTRIMSYLREDFESLRDLLNGVIRERPRDEWAGREQYLDAEEDAGAGVVVGSFYGTGVVALDTETTPEGRLWCASFSREEGTGVVVQRVYGEILDQEVELVGHNLPFDLTKMRLAGIDLKVRELHDTLTMARLLQLESGRLKDLSRRYLGMQMQDYTDVVGPIQPILSRDYLLRAWEIVTTPSFLASHPPQAVEKVEWDKKSGGLITRTSHPWPLWRRVEALLKALGEVVVRPEHLAKKGKGKKREGEEGAAEAAGSGRELVSSPVQRWREWSKEGGEEEIRAVEEEMGKHPEAYLAHVEREKAIHYSGRDADASLRLFRFLKPRITEARLDEVYDIDRRTIPYLVEMMVNGIQLDVPYLRELVKELEWRKGPLELACWELAGHSFNLGSGDQVARVLFEELKLPVIGWTDGGKPSTQDDFVLPLKGRHAIVGKVLEWRRLDKMINTYGLPLLGQRDREGRIHCDYSGMTVTGRLAPKNPNLGAIPKRSEEGKLIRKAFVAGEGCVLLSHDYDQVEMRIMAHESQDKGMLEVFWDGEDIHTRTAMKMFGLPKEKIDKTLHRLPAKNCGFGTIYGIGAAGLQIQLNQFTDRWWTEEECQGFLDSYRGVYPGIERYWQDQVAYGRRHGEVRDMFGRRRLVPELYSPRGSVRKEGERYCANHPIQAGAQGVIKKAMGEIWERIEEAREYGKLPGGDRAVWRGVRPLLQIHDQLVHEVREEVAEEAEERIRGIMEGQVRLSLALPVSVSVGTRLGEMEE